MIGCALFPVNQFFLASRDSVSLLISLVYGAGLRGFGVDIEEVTQLLEVVLREQLLASSGPRSLLSLQQGAVNGRCGDRPH